MWLRGRGCKPCNTAELESEIHGSDHNEGSHSYSGLQIARLQADKAELHDCELHVCLWKARFMESVYYQLGKVVQHGRICCTAAALTD